MMITSVEVEKFEPFGKAFCLQHPFANAQSQADSSSNQQDKNESTCKWKLRSLRENPDCHEELFIQNNTVVWSVGKSQKVRTVKKCYTAKSPVLDCLWCTFHLPSGNSSGDQDTENTGEPLHSLCIVQNDCIDVLSKDGALFTITLPFPVLGEPLHSLCIVQNDCIDVLSKDGALFTITLPFPVKQVVSLKEGLLLERTTEPGEVMGQKRDVPTMFSVLHPLDEPRPVISKVQGKISKICDPTVSVVFTCSDPALVMTYDFVIGLHSVWHVSKAKAEDCPESPTHADHPAELHFSNILHHPTPVLSAGAHSRLSAATPVSFSPFRSFTPTSAIKAHVQSPAPIRLLSPALNQISLNRTMSPAIDSPLGIGLRSPLAFCSPTTSCCSSKEESSWDSFQPLLPEVCLTQVWQETQIAVRHGTKGKASKAFLTQDKFGATFLCYLLGQLDKLRGVQFTQEGDCLEFTNTFEIPARDAVPMEKLNMMLVLEPNCTLVIYSGMVKGSQVHLPVFPIIRVHESPQFNSPDKILSFTSVHLNKSDVDMADLEVRQSKTKPLQEMKVTSLRDAVSTTCNLVLTDESICRITLPMLSQNMAVTACLEALKCLLPAPLVIKSHLACYASAQVPHSQDSRGEWKWFTDCILDLMGYPPNSREKCDSPDLPAAKKSKTQAEDNENKAWEMLMNSAFHQDATRQENGLHQLINKEMPFEMGHSFNAHAPKGNSTPQDDISSKKIPVPLEEET